MANAIIIEPRRFDVQYADELAAAPARHLGNDYRGVIYQSPARENVSLTLDLGGDVPVDVAMLFGLWGNIVAGAKLIIAAATAEQGPGFNQPPVQAGGSGVGSYYGDGAVSIFAGFNPIADGNGVMLWRKPSWFPDRFRYLNLYFYDLTAAGYIRASRLVVGKAIELERNFSFGASFGVKDLGSLEFSRRGVLLRNRGAKLRTTSLTFSNIRKDEVEAQTKPLLERIGNTECVAIVTDPAPHDQRQSRCYFGPLVGDLGHTWRRAGAWEAKANLVSIF
jgi:hypothetical protein